MRMDSVGFFLLVCLGQWDLFLGTLIGLVAGEAQHAIMLDTLRSGRHGGMRSEARDGRSERRLAWDDKRSNKADELVGKKKKRVRP